MKKSIYVLSDEQVKQLQSLNTSQVLFVACDYGKGPSVGVTDLDEPVFQKHKDMLESFGLVSEEVEVSSYF